jgi:uncharacterized protein YegP (UPF0339 family)
MNDPKFQIKDSADGQIYFVLVAANGEVIATSETYKSKQGCKVGIKAVQIAAAGAIIEDLTL